MINVSLQDYLFHMSKKRGQEEMVGFILIIVIVAIILLVLLSITIRRPREDELIQSYEIESFISSSLHYTTDCEDNLEYLPLRKLIIECSRKSTCLDSRDSCKVLEETLGKMLNESFRIGSKGYLYTIETGEEVIVSLSSGNESGTYKGAFQDLGRDDLTVTLKVYS
jgi:hypothetical protein